MVRPAVGIVLVGLLLQLSLCQAALRFANYYHNHMVLQKEPKQANIWGFANTIGDTVDVYLNAQKVGNTTVTKRTDGHAGGMWQFLLPQQSAGGHATVEVRSSEGSVKIVDVAFGDVWICSGQSNMAFAVSRLVNYTDVIAAAMKMPNLRFMQMALRSSNTSLLQSAIASPWQRPLNNSQIQKFSAVCLLYGMQLMPHINRPIGLVETSWGGTNVEAWSSPDALAQCQTHRTKRGPHQPNVLWNAMVVPLLPMTIFGTIWYQGEANANHADDYKCSFPAMIEDWRQKFNAQSQGQTDSQFPFGFVQLAPNKNQTLHFGFPDLRWSQTAGYGYVPNPVMNNVFMAVAMDLPDFHSPYGSIHPRDKFDVAERLALAGRAVAYGESGLDYQGPFPTRVSNHAHSITVEYDHGNSAIEVRDNDGFETCCAPFTNNHCQNNHWVAAPITGHGQTTVTIATHCHGTPTALRYAWEMSPCEFMMCAIYDQSTDLPAPSFVWNLNSV